MTDKVNAPAGLAWYQKSLIFTSGFAGWHIISFVVGIVVGSWYLAAFVFPKPAGGFAILDPKTNAVFATFLWTSAVLFLKTLAIPWTEVYIGCVNNSFTRNPEDLATGSGNVPAKERDPIKERFNRIHQNDLENVPFMIMFALVMVLVSPEDWVAGILMKVNLTARIIHTVWYAIAGSHEIRATLWSINCFCMVGYIFQIFMAL
jgi:glutathione S-transferase